MVGLLKYIHVHGLVQLELFNLGAIMYANIIFGSTKDVLFIKASGIQIMFDGVYCGGKLAGSNFKFTTLWETM